VIVSSKFDWLVDELRKMAERCKQEVEMSNRDAPYWCGYNKGCANGYEVAADWIERILEGKVE